MAKSLDVNRFVRKDPEAEKFSGEREDARNKFADAYQSAIDQYQGKVQANADQVANLQRQKERAGNLNWGDEVLAGAGAGSAAGPWGALIGGAIGATSGLINYGKEADKYGGQDFGDFLLGGVPNMTGGNVQAASGLAGMTKGNIDQNNMMEALDKRRLAVEQPAGNLYEPSGEPTQPQAFQPSGPPQMAGNTALGQGAQYGPYAGGPSGGAPPGGEFSNFGPEALFPGRKRNMGM